MFGHKFRLSLAAWLMSKSSPTDQKVLVGFLVQLWDFCLVGDNSTTFMNWMFMSFVLIVPYAFFGGGL